MNENTLRMKTESELRCVISDLTKQIAARDHTIAEQAEALEGYRRFISEWMDGMIYCVDVPEEKRLYPVVRHFLPAHEIAALRRLRVEVENE